MKLNLEPPIIPQSAKSCSAPAFDAASSKSPSEQYQPMPAMWKHQPPPSSVWNSQTPEYMQRYFQQPAHHAPAAPDAASYLHNHAAAAAYTADNFHCVLFAAARGAGATSAISILFLLVGW